jgi:hypothetical protein
VTDLDSSEQQTLSGRELLETGLSVALKEQPAAALMTYRMRDSQTV